MGDDAQLLGRRPRDGKIDQRVAGFFAAGFAAGFPAGFAAARTGLALHPDARGSDASGEISYELAQFGAVPMHGVEHHGLL